MTALNLFLWQSSFEKEKAGAHCVVRIEWTIFPFHLRIWNICLKAEPINEKIIPNI